MAPLKGGATMPHGAWRIATRRRLLADVSAVVSPQVPATHCQHRSRDGGCGGGLTEDTAELHIESCKTGGGVVTIHNGIRDFLLKFVKDHIDPHAKHEQRLDSLKAGRLEKAPQDADEADVLDVVWHEGGRMVAIDIAVVHADSCDQARRRAAAGRDGVAAERAERAKRSRYAGLAITPFVIEAGGRPGAAAQSIVRSLAKQAGVDPAALWQAISVKLHTGQSWQYACGACSPAHVVAAGAA